jgi:chromosome segregation ATPase
MRGAQARMNNFEESINDMSGDENKLYRERERLMRAYEQKRTELSTYENNLGFFNSKSKSGDSMLRELERKIQRIKEDLATLEQKIKVIDSHL